MTITDATPATAEHAAPLMIVENNDLDVERVSRMLRRLDARNPLVHVTDGQQALDELRAQDSRSLARHRFGMLVDLNMPRMNGFELIEELKRDPTINPACVFIVTTSDRPQDRSRAVELGADGYLVKPVAAEDIADVLAQIGEPVATSVSHHPSPVVDRFLMAIDDDDLILERLRRNLVGSSWTFEGFTSPDLGLRRFASQRPAVLLVDRRMPKTDGLALLQQLHESRGLDGVDAALMSEVMPPRPVVDALAAIGVSTMDKDDVTDKDVLLARLGETNGTPPNRP